MFNSINTAGTGLQTYHTWLDVIANNVANVNDTAATDGKVFHEQYLQAEETTGDGPVGQGVHVAAIGEKAGDGDIVHDPANPLADADGNIRRADVNLAGQMGDMIIAQRAFQANANVVDRAKEIYSAAISIGKGI